jgi:hypothetical protein
MPPKYVYTHVDPETGEVVYVGQGVNERAFLIHASKRDAAHTRWLTQQAYDGYTMLDIVKIPYRMLTKERATQVEQILIARYNPRFNTAKGVGSMTDRVRIVEARALRAQGYTYAQIAESLGIARMSAWRYINVVAK